MCAATLLNKRYAMTAMHCVEYNEAIADEITVSNVPDFLTPTIVLSGKIITFLRAEDAFFALENL